MAKSILIIDDHPVNLELVKVLMVLEGYEVHTAGDAEGALLLLADLRPDLILMDVQLPGMDGLELARRLKADPVHKDVPIIIITTEGSSEDRQRALQLGANAYITKPIQAPQVIAKVKELLKIEA